MPTGYTAALHDGDQSLRDFILTCARAMGATIMQRDDPLDSPPKEQQPDVAYYDRRIAESAAKIAQAEAWSDQEATRRADEEHAKAVESWREAVAKTTAIVARYEAMLASVEAWVPPTVEHEGLKKFMADQLRESIRFDGFKWEAPLPAPSGEAYRAEFIATAERALAHARADRDAEIERTNGRNRWIAALYASLPAAVTR